MSRIKTRNAIKKQLLENTGSHPCDSGGAYGYNYDKIKGHLDFKEGLRVYEYGVTIPIQRYLYASLDRDEACEKLEKTLLRELKLQGVEYIDLCYSNSEELEEVFNNIGATPKFGKKTFDWVNTYNYDSDLSQVIQFVEFEFNDTNYVILETHNGCDVRGGYSSGRVYEVVDEYFGYAQVMHECQIDEDYEEISLWNDCEFNKELNKWVMKDTQKEVLHSCNGYNFQIY